MLIELYALTQLASSCPHVQEIPDWRVRVESKVESGRDSLAIGDNGTKEHPFHRAYAPTSLDEAIQIAGTLVAQGHRVDAGLMQINSANWERLGLTVQTVFVAQANVCAGVRILAEDYAAERALERRVSCRYQTGHPDCTTSYPDIIEAEHAREVADPVVVTSASQDASVSAPPQPAPWDAYGIARALRPARSVTSPVPSAPVEASKSQTASYAQR